MRRRCDNVSKQSRVFPSDEEDEHKWKVQKYINNNDHDVSKWLIEYRRNWSNDLLEYHWIWWQFEIKLKNTNIVYKMHCKNWWTNSINRFRSNQIIGHMNLIKSHVGLLPFLSCAYDQFGLWQTCVALSFQPRKEISNILYFFGVMFVASKLNLRLRFQLMNFILNIHGKAYDLWIFCSKCSFLCLS